MTAGRPTKFYRYRQIVGESAKYLERTLCHNEIYFPAPITFNDPFDCLATFSYEGTDDELINDYMRIARKHGPLVSEAELRLDAEQMLVDPSRNPRSATASNAIQDQYARTVRSEIGVLCISEVCDDILMWSHYADFHRGICLEFDGEAMFMQHANRVTYAKHRPKIDAYRDSNDTKLDKALLTKSDHWSYEREWRLIRYQGGPGVVAFRPENLTGVIFGVQAVPENVKLVTDWVNQRATRAKLYQACVNRHAYALDIVEVSA